MGFFNNYLKKTKLIVEYNVNLKIKNNCIIKDISLYQPFPFFFQTNFYFFLPLLFFPHHHLSLYTLFYLHPFLSLPQAVTTLLPMSMSVHSLALSPYLPLSPSPSLPISLYFFCSIHFFLIPFIVLTDIFFTSSLGAGEVG